MKIGCPVDLGFRVQYSDLAMLKTVQLQILGADNSVLIDNLGSTSRTEWGGKLSLLSSSMPSLVVVFFVQQVM